MRLSNTQLSREQQMPSEFSVEDATALLHSTVIKLDAQEPFSISDIGIVCGLLTFNDEVEIVIKFADQLGQYTRSEYELTFRQIDPG